VRICADEIIYAAGALPVPAGSDGRPIDGAGECIFTNSSVRFTKSLLHLGLQGEYSFLDGVCFLNGCDQLRRMIGIWQEKVKSPGKNYLEMFTVPHKFTEDGFKWYL
jgi:hypothetical protein